MIPELGHFALVVALFIGVALAVLPVVGAAREWHERSMDIGPSDLSVP